MVFNISLNCEDFYFSMWFFKKMSFELKKMGKFSSVCALMDDVIIVFSFVIITH